MCVINWASYYRRTSARGSMRGTVRLPPLFSSRSLTMWALLLTAGWGAFPSVGLAQGLNEPDDELSTQPITDREFHLSMTPGDAEETHELIGKLAAPAYADRANAAERLIEKGIRMLAMLRAAYHRAEELEVQLQIERIVLAVYLDEYVYGRSGFLGITQGGAPHPTHHDDPRIPEGGIGINIRDVHNDTAAARAGLQAADVIVEIDGELLKPGPNPTQAFGDLIRRRGPGGKIKLRVLRVSDEKTVEVTLARCPPEMVERGLIQAVSKRLYDVRDRFDVWWERYFMDAAAVGSGEPAGGS